MGTLKIRNKKKLSKNLSKQIFLESNNERKAFEKKVKDFERDIQNLDDKHEYLTCNNKLEAIYDDIANGIKVRSRCDWFEHGEKSSFFFFLTLKDIEQLNVKSIPFFIITR